MSISTEKAVIARLIYSGKKFEILVDPEKALEIKMGKEIPLEDLVVIDYVFEDSAKGKRASEEDLKKAFGTEDFKEIAYKIIKKGEVHLTTEQRKRMKEEKINKIVNIISRKSIDPQRKIPHPPQRILNAMKEAKINVNEMESAESQVERIVQELRPVLPISMEMVDISIKIPAMYAAQTYGKIKDFGKIKKEEWKNNGSWLGIVEIPAGVQGDFYNLLNKMTKGEVETKIMK